MKYYSSELDGLHFNVTSIIETNTGAVESTPNGITFTGWYETLTDRIWYGIRGDHFGYGEGKFGVYLAKDESSDSAVDMPSFGDQSHTVKESKNLITEIIRYNQNIVNNNILCAQMLATIPEGRMPASERTKAENTIRYLQKRAEESQQKLVDDGYITNVQYGAPVDYKYISALNTIRNGGSVKPVGVLPGAAVSTVAAAASSIPVWGWVVAAFVIGIALTAGVWYAYVKMRDERVGDLKNFSEPLMQTLQSYLPDDVYNQAVEELNERVDEAYKRGKQNSMSELFDKVLIAGAAFFLTYALIKGDER